MDTDYQTLSIFGTRNKEKYTIAENIFGVYPEFSLQSTTKLFNIDESNLLTRNKLNIIMF